MHGLTQEEGQQMQAEQRQELTEAVARVYNAVKHDGLDEDMKLIIGGLGLDWSDVEYMMAKEAA